MLLADIMTLKRKGEVGLEEIYAGAPKGVTYTIVRPGGLTDGGIIGPAGKGGPREECTFFRHMIVGRGGGKGGCVFFFLAELHDV